MAVGERGLAPATVRGHAELASRFLAERISPDGKLDVQHLTGADVTGFFAGRVRAREAGVGRLLRQPAALAAALPEPAFRYVPCSSPLRIEAPALGAHTVDVRAIDPSGIPDSTPARSSWRTVAPRVDLCGQITTDRTIGPDEANVYVITCDLQITTTGTLRIQPGAIIKGHPSRGFTVDGSLVANGTAAEPVTFTSVKDDSVGGDTNGDGGASQAAAGDWEGIRVHDGGAAELNETTLRYASTALDVADGGGADIHGKVLDSAMGVVASGAVVDATDVDWGDPSGPAPEGDGTPISGDWVIVTPWVGYVPPPKPPFVPYQSTPTQHACKQILFVGVRGSGEPPRTEPPYSGEPWQNMGTRVPPVRWGLEDRFAQTYPESTPEIREIALEYPAADVGWSQISSGEFQGSIWQGVSPCTACWSMSMPGAQGSASS